MERKLFLWVLSALLLFFSGCGISEEKKDKKTRKSAIQRKVEDYVQVKLTSDLSKLNEKQKKMLALLFDASKIVDEIFWEQACPNRQMYLDKIKDEYKRRYFMINYGPWDRLDANKPFIKDVEKKPLGAYFYPTDMTYQEFQDFESEDKYSLYTLIRRDEDGTLKTVPYHEAYKEKLQKVADLLNQAAEYAENDNFSNYLKLRAKALLTDDYMESDLAWMDMKENLVDYVVGPIDDNEDMLFWAKASYKAMILIKDKKLSQELERFTLLLDYLQKSLPVPDKYKKEKPGKASDFGVYDILFYAGDCNAGSKTIAINLPRCGAVQLKKGSRKLNFKNTMKAKFDKILVPISNVIIDKEQRKYVNFDAFFHDIMFYEVSNGLGLVNTVNGKGTVKEALKDYYSVVENTKADVLSLYFITKLHDMNELGENHNLMENYVTFMADIFRSVRFGATSPQGKANMIRFYYFQEKGAFTRDEKKGTYSVNKEKMKEAIFSLAEKILLIQGDGDYDEAKALVQEMGFIREELYRDLVKIAKSDIPKDVVFKQGKEVAGL